MFLQARQFGRTRSMLRLGAVVVAVGVAGAMTTPLLPADAATKTTKKTVKATKTTKAAAKTTKPTATTSAAAPSTAAPAKGGTLRFHAAFDVASMDPVKWLASQVTQQFTYFSVFGHLAVENKKTGEADPQMAESITTTDNGKTWLIKLHPNMKFSDGTAFDAAAIKSNWDRIAAPANASPALPNLNALDSYTVVDATTLRAVLKVSNTQWPHALAFSGLGVIGSPTAISSMGADYANKPVGAGPFILKEWVRGDHLTFVRNPTYWDAPRPYVDEIIVKIVTDESQRYNSLESGQADIMFTTLNTANDQAKAKGFSILPLPALSGTGLYLNLRKPPFNDVRVRTAVMQAIDLNQINKIVWNQDNPPTSLFPPDSPYFDPAIKLPKADFTEANHQIGSYVTSTGKELEITFSTLAGSPIYATLGELMKAQIERMALVKVKLESLDIPTYVAKTRTGDIQMGIGALGGAAFDPAVREQYYSTGTGNTTGYSSPAMDALFDKLRASTTTAAQLAVIKDISKLFMKDLPYLPLRLSTYFYISSSKVKDIVRFDEVQFRPDLVRLG